MAPLTGGCMCGAVGYTLTQTAEVVTHCHCKMCRRSVGAPTVTWATLPRSAVLLRGEAALVWYRSSSRARRAFCGQCGTSLLFASDALPDQLDVTVGSLDAPELCPPTCHIYVPDKVAWVGLEPALPRHVADSSSPLLP